MEDAVQETFTKAECDAYVSSVMVASDHYKRYKIVEKIIKTMKSTYLAPKHVANLLSQHGSPIFILASQAWALRNIIRHKLDENEDGHYYDHVLCSRTLDYWNLRSEYGTEDNRGSACYYTKDHLPKRLSIEGIFREQSKDFLKDYAFHDLDGDIYTFKSRFLPYDNKYKRKRTKSKFIRPIITRTPRMRRRPVRLITEI
jgi:hypothetical protein